jgi:hypothetical protein
MLFLLVLTSSRLLQLVEDKNPLGASNLYGKTKEEEEKLIYILYS